MGPGQVTVEQLASDGLEALEIRPAAEQREGFVEGLLACYRALKGKKAAGFVVCFGDLRVVRRQRQ